MLLVETNAKVIEFAQIKAYQWLVFAARKLNAATRTSNQLVDRFMRLNSFSNCKIDHYIDIIAYF